MAQSLQVMSKLLVQSNSCAFSMNPKVELMFQIIYFVVDYGFLLFIIEKDHSVPNHNIRSILATGQYEKLC